MIALNMADLPTPMYTSAGLIISKRFPQKVCCPTSIMRLPMTEALTRATALPMMVRETRETIIAMNLGATR
jgi:hypothetical protein